MKRFMVIGRKKSIWFLLGAALYILVILLGLGNMAASLVSAGNRELPIYSVQREEPLVALTFNCAWEKNDIPQLLDLLEKENREDIILEVDGNITPENGRILRAIGASRFVAGTSAIFKGNPCDYAYNIDFFRKSLED